MNITDLTAQQLRRAASIKEQIQRTPQFAREFTSGWNFFREEAQDERGGEK